MAGVRVDAIDVEFPSGRQCRPECLGDLRKLGGELASVRKRYEKACEHEKRACAYLEALTNGEEDGLRKACNGGRAPNFEGACRRLKHGDWLR
jgi:hypothetical protein